VPALERPFVSLGGLAWHRPAVGRFYRSAAYRLGVRLRKGDARFRSVSIADRRLVLDVTEFTAGPLYFGGSVYEPATTDYFVRHLAKGSVFVDVGANHGYFTVLAAALVGPNGRVVAFEPNPRVFEQLQTHVRLNHFESQVQLVRCALGAQPDPSARLYVSQDEWNSGLSSLIPRAGSREAAGDPASATVSVPVDTLDRWMAAADLERIDLLKIDVEGAEALAIRGMAAALRAGRIESLIVETLWDGPAHRMLCDAGYVAQALDPIGDLTNILFVRKARAARI
jgi:FkbM family methyltransferase